MSQALVLGWWHRIRPWADLIALAAAIALVWAIGRRLPLGIAGLGVVAGSSVALQAMGLVLLYRATRIINFAQVAYGIWAGALFYQLVGHQQFLVLLHAACGGCVPGIPGGDAGSLWNLQNNPRVVLDALARHHAGWMVAANFWVSAVLCLAIGANAALQLHAWTARFWQKVPRLVPTVATLGWATVLVVWASSLATLRQGNFDFDCFGLCSVRLHPLFGWWPYDDTKGLQGIFTVPWREASFTLPFDTSHAHFNTQDLLYVGLAVVAALAIIALLRFTRTGVYLRGIADNQERAETLGVDVNRSLFSVWAIGGVLSTLVVMIQVTGGPPNYSAQLGAGTLTQMLAVAVFARMSSIPRVLIASLGLGIVDNALFYNTGSHALFFLIQLVIIGVALMLQRRKLTRAELESAVAWLSSPEIRPTPARLRQLPLVRTWLSWAPVAGITLLLGLPFFLDAGQVTLMTVILSYTIVGISVFILTGWAGQISLGQFGFAALGGFVAVILYSKFSVPLPLATLAALLVSAAAATAVGFPALRLPGPYLAVVSLAVAVAIAELLVSPRSPSLGVNLPVRLERPLLLGLDTNDERVFYYFSLTLLAVTVAVVAGLRRSRMRRALIAARDNEPAAQAFGINVTIARLEAFAVSGVIAALGGVLLAFEERGVRVNGFDPAIGITIFLLVVIGGAGSLAGPLLGSIYNAVFTLPGAGFAAIATGGGVISVLQFGPAGLGGLMFKARDAILRRMAIRNRIAAPSLLADLTSTSSGALRAQIAPWLRSDGSEVLVETQFELVGGGPGPVAGTFLSTNGTAPAPGKGASLTQVMLAADGDQPEALLECRQVGVHYDAVQALFNVDFSARAGEIVALVGTNGAGKTTLLRAIAGLHPAARGAIVLDGEDITRRAPHLVSRLGVTMVPGGAGVFPSLSVAENLRAAGWHAGASSGPGLDRVLDYFPRLRERLDAAAGNLSGGEQQMLALAQAFLVNPRVLLIDELSIGLAAGVVDTIHDVLRQFRDEGMAIVIVEQSLSRSTAIADRAVVLEKGEVRYSGPARQLLEHPELFQAISFGAGGVGIGGSSEVTRRRRNLGDVEQIALEVSGVSASYGGVAAVRDVTLQLSAGEIVGLIGPNGAGKTTLFDVISGFHPADAGAVMLAGVDVTRLQPHARANLGLMRSFQNVRLFPSLTVRDNIAAALERHVRWKESVFNGLWLPMGRRAEAKAQARVDMLVELLGLGAQVDRTMAEIPIGTRRIVDIACQLAARPRVLLLDEPSSGLAQLETEQLGPIITRIAKDLDAGILVIEHDIPLVSSISNRLVALDLGAVIAEGAPAAVLADQRVRSSYFGGSAPPSPAAAPGRLEPVAVTV